MKGRAGRLVRGAGTFPGPTVGRLCRAAAWHEWLGEPTIADAIMDRLLHSAHTLALNGESLRRRKP